jgi:hypothetical protein
MEPYQVEELRKGLTIRRMKSDLLRELRCVRPTLSWSTLNVALDDPGQSTPVLDWVREVGAKMLCERQERESAARQPMIAAAA